MQGIEFALVPCLSIPFFVFVCLNYLTMGNEDDGKQGLSMWATTRMVFAIYVSAALLQMPFAFSICGWVTTASIFVVTGTMIFTGGMLIDCLGVVDGDNIDLAEIGNKAFGPMGEKFVNIALMG